MSSETESTSSSRSGSTRCVDAETADSLNSLIAKKGTDYANCMDAECTLASQCCDDVKLKRRSYCCNPIGQCVWGVLLIILSISGFIFTPLDFMLWEKLNMRPGFPPFEWWADPPDEVKLRVHVFNVTNHERWQQGLVDKLNVQEIGPVVYLEKLLHSDMKFNENGTMSYTAKRTPIFLPEHNTVDLNSTIIVPNLAVLGMASYLHGANYLVRTGFRFLVDSHGSPMFVKKTIYEYLWDYREPVLDTSKNLAPGMVPVNNMGMLARIYDDFTDEVTVKIGPQWGHRGFFQIDRFRGEPQLPGYDPDQCPDRIVGSTEGVMYPQHLTKNDVLHYWRKTVCKIMPLYFDSEIILDNVPVYRYNLSENVYARVKNGTDCYDTEPSLPQGLSDGSKCYFNFPMVVSYPHFYTGEPAKDHYVTGLQPDRYKHNSYVIVEPATGIPFRSVARMQSNLRIHDLSGFPAQYRKFSNLVLPLFWAEYNQEGLPSHIQAMIYFMVVLLPPLSLCVLSLALFMGSFLILKQIYKHKLKNDSLSSVINLKKASVNTFTKNKIFQFEKETFLNKPS